MLVVGGGFGGPPAGALPHCASQHGAAGTHDTWTGPPGRGPCGSSAPGHRRGAGRLARGRRGGCRPGRGDRRRHAHRAPTGSQDRWTSPSARRGTAV
ncbi:hypothetical protein CTZ28_10305 [Streptomyces shenzhenensis]|uniref:Uncharacterized protein n=1 Tax=Streptomyces shenzhenensis TaxID=943815 RepID=A0A3M0IAQ5_9ACTN|nr:hypothetical protein CTZ28_10305 [Streptomyces shenzhenensis]